MGHLKRVGRDARRYKLTSRKTWWWWIAHGMRMLGLKRLMHATYLKGRVVRKRYADGTLMGVDTISSMDMFIVRTKKLER